MDIETDRGFKPAAEYFYFELNRRMETLRDNRQLKNLSAS